MYVVASRVREPRARHVLIGMLLILASTLTGSLAAAPGVRAGTTIVVTTTENERNQDGDCSLKEAMDAANVDRTFDRCRAGNGADTVLLPAGTFVVSESSLSISGDVSIIGAGRTATTIDGTGGYGHILFTSNNARLSVSRLTIRNGRDYLRQGGAAIIGGHVTVHDAAFIGNVAEGAGGAIKARSLVVTASEFQGNRAHRGGAIAVHEGTAVIRRSTFVDNHATGVGPGGEPSRGGAIDIDAGEQRWARADVIESDFRNNRADSGETQNRGSGGAIAVSDYARLDLVGSTLSGNLAWDGDGLWTEGQTIVTNTTINANGALDRFAGRGGGIHNERYAYLRNVTLVGNRSSPGGGGNLFSDSTIYARNTIAAHSSTGSCASPARVISEGNNLDWAGTGNPDQRCFGSGPGDVNADPAFPSRYRFDMRILLPPAYNGGPTRTFAIGPTSAAYDKGATCALTDQRGVPRPQGASCDIGAFEYAVCQGVPVNMVGTQGADTLIGTATNESVLALGGNDVIETGDGDDRVCAGSGDDLVRLGVGNDTADGGIGADRVSYSRSTTAVSVDLAAGTATGEGNDRIVGFENVTGSPFPDVLRGSSLPNAISGGGSDDQLFGRESDDLLYGEGGNDAIDGGLGTDLCHQGTGTGVLRECAP